MDAGYVNAKSAARSSTSSSRDSGHARSRNPAGPGSRITRAGYGSKPGWSRVLARTRNAESSSSPYARTRSRVPGHACSSAPVTSRLRSRLKLSGQASGGGPGTGGWKTQATWISSDSVTCAATCGGCTGSRSPGTSTWNGLNVRTGTARSAGAGSTARTRTQTMITKQISSGISCVTAATGAWACSRTARICSVPPPHISNVIVRTSYRTPRARAADHCPAARAPARTP